MLLCTFSSLFLGIRFATQGGSPRKIAGAGLSVPFSSGFALRRGVIDRLREQGWLSVPFSSGFALRHFLACCCIDWPNPTFSSLFLGIRFATGWNDGPGSSCSHLSVPFSSGFALRPGPRSWSCHPVALLSVPFSSGFALRQA